MSAEKTIDPKVFISYSQSSDAHQTAVVSLAEKLISDGIGVVLDVWDLKKGHNLHKFMESMVTSDSITKVLLVIDKEYQRKADKGTGGVGIETEIVSAQIYNKADQEKFIPVVWERDQEGKAYLPVFLQSRVYVDLSGDNQRDDYQDLVRVIYDKPRFVKPALGKAPAFIQDESLAAVPSSFSDVKQTVRKGELSKKPFVLKEFFSDVLQAIRALNILEEPKGALDDEVIAKIQSFQPLLLEYDKVIVDLVEVTTSDVIKSLRDFFEGCLQSYTPGRRPGSHFPARYSAIQFVSQELLLHTVAAFLNAEKFSELDELIGLGLVDRKVGFEGLGNIFNFYEHLRVLDEGRKDRLKLNRTSITADLLKERADSGGVISFKEIAQADLILFLRSQFTGLRGWYPRTIVYFDEWNTFDIFFRGEVLTFFNKFTKVLGVKDKNEFLKKWEEHKDEFNHLRVGWRPLSLSNLCNVNKLGTR
jgi:hypothetical protein